MSFVVKTFWIVLLGLSICGIVALGVVGIPAKPITIYKSISADRLP
jgi:hypothetical protein